MPGTGQYRRKIGNEAIRKGNQIRETLKHLGHRGLSDHATSPQGAIC
jgi:hypothetical protein